MAGKTVTVSMLIQANAAQAKAEVGALARETSGLRTVTTDLARAVPALTAGYTGADTAADGLRDSLAAAHREMAAQTAALVDGATASAAYRTELDDIRASLNPFFAAAQQQRDAIVQISAAEDLGAISAREAAVMHDQLARSLIKTQGAADAAGLPLGQIGPRADASATGIQALINRLNGINAATDGTVASHLQHGMALDALRARFDPLFAASRQYELVLGEIAEAERLGALTAAQAGAARQRAAQSIMGSMQGVGQMSRATQASIANLGYQANDVVMMIAAGQNPMMLALQQGTQITQVFGQLRAAGQKIGPAVAGAFTQLLNPMSLVTLAAIAGAAALVQWGMKTLSAGENTAKLAEATEALDDATKRYIRTVSAIRMGVTEEEVALVERVNFLMAEQIRLQGIAATKSKRGAGGVAAAALTKVIAEADALNDKLAAYRAAREEAQQLAAVGRARSLIATERERAELAEAILMYGERSAQVDYIRTAQAMAAVEAKIRELGIDRAGVEANEMRVESVRRLINEEAARQLAVQTAAAAMQSGLQAEINLRTVAARHGEDSLAYQAAQAVAAREAYEAQLDAANVTGSLKANLLSAWDNARGIAGVNLAAGIWAAVQAASVLDAQLANIRLAEMQVEFSPGGQAMARWGSRAPGGTAEQKALADRHKPKKVRSGGGRKKEQDEVQSLIEAQRRQIAALRELDPVQREILENHAALAKATQSERETVEGLIAERMRLEDIRDKIDEIGQTGEQAFKGLITGAHGFKDALAMVIDKLADMLASEAWSLLWGGGKGGLGGLLGGLFGGGGGLFGGLFSGGGLFAGLADGGLVTGPGGPREDRIPAMLSNREFVVNAAATSRHLPLIEAINAGARPDQLLAMLLGSGPQRLADGGMVGLGASAPSWARSMPGASQAGGAGGGASPHRMVVEFVQRVDRDGNLRAFVQEVSAEGFAPVLKQSFADFTTHVLPAQVTRINEAPRERGRPAGAF